MININLSAGHPILKKCRSLYEYSYFMQTIRNCLKSSQNRDEAVKAAINHCLQMHIMTDFLKKHGSEVINMLFTEFNMNDALEVRYEEGLEDGIQQGKEAGIQLGKEVGIQLGIQQEALHGIVSTIRLCRKFGISREETLQSIMSEYDLKRQDAEKHMRQYWL